jgi:hypothetical protein
VAPFRRDGFGGSRFPVAVRMNSEFMTLRDSIRSSTFPTKIGSCIREHQEGVRFQLFT